MARSGQKPKREYDLLIDNLTHDGRGVGRQDGKVVFVSGALPGERVLALQTGRNRHFDEAKVIEVSVASADRIQPRCQHFGVCSGCVLQHLDHRHQIESKQNILLDNLKRIGHVEPEAILPVLLANEWHYRRKGRFSVRYVEKKGAVLVGFRETDPRFVAQLLHCETATLDVSALIQPLVDLVGRLSIRSEIPQIEFIQGDGPVALVFRNLAALEPRDFTELSDFERKFGTQIFLQSGGAHTVVALRADYEPLYFDLKEHGIRLQFRPLDFIQVNAALNEAMISRALKLLNPQPKDVILDLFCGLGNFTLPLAKKAGMVIGVEGDHGLVSRARENALMNGIQNVDFFAADLTLEDKTQPWRAMPYSKMLLDPPRAGAIEVLKNMNLDAIKTIVYVSCHPASLARDAAYLTQECGYRLTEAGAMDMFPQTAHVEAIAVFEKA